MDWIPLALFGTVTGLVAVVYATLKDELREIRKEIGDRKSGIRGELHNLRDTQLGHRAAFVALGDFIKFDVWRYFTKRDRED